MTVGLKDNLLLERQYYACDFSFSPQLEVYCLRGNVSATLPRISWNWVSLAGRRLKRGTDGRENIAQCQRTVTDRSKQGTVRFEHMAEQHESRVMAEYPAKCSGRP